MQQIPVPVAITAMICITLIILAALGRTGKKADGSGKNIETKK